MAKKTTTADLRNLSPEELHEKMDNLKKNLMLYRFQSKTGKLERQNLVSDTRRDIARVLTIINEKIRENQVKEGKKL